MKCAREMFEELGYIYSKVSGNIYVEDKWLNCFNELYSKKIVIFETHKKFFKCYHSIHFPGEISGKLFKAIQQQITELGWED